MDRIIDISGLEGLAEDLADLPEAIVRELFPDALAAGGAVIEQDLRARTPERAEPTTSSKKYGRMKDDVATTVRVNPKRLAGSARVGMSVTGHVARFLEFGHRDVTGGYLTVDGKGSGREVGFTPAKPFMRPAADSSAEAAGDAFIESLTGNK